MAILDKLVERKDVGKYIDGRIKILKYMSSPDQLRKLPPKKREATRKSCEIRIKEMKKTKHVIVETHKEKEMATKYWEGTRSFREDL